MSVLLISVLCLAKAAQQTVIEEHTTRLSQFGVDLNAIPHTQPPVVADDISAWRAAWNSVVQRFRMPSFSSMLKGGAISSSVVLTLSPMRTVQKMRMSQSTLSYPPYTFLLIFGVALQWCVYGFFAFKVTTNVGFLILVYSNVLGVIMGAMYSLSYFNNIQDSSRHSQFWITAQSIFTVYAAEAVVIYEQPHPKALLIVGTISACMSVMVSASPLLDLPNILKKRCADSMPFDVVVANFFASALWLSCAVMLHDSWILIPNMFGLALGTVQLTLIMTFSYKNMGKGATMYGAVPDLEKPVVIDGTGGTL